MHFLRDSFRARAIRGGFRSRSSEGGIRVNQNVVPVISEAAVRAQPSAGTANN
jgi:hypothetical protein